MPIVIHRPDLAPKREVFPYDRIVGVIIMVVVGLWLLYDVLGIMLLGSVEGFFTKIAPGEAEKEIADLNRIVVLDFVKTLGFGSWFVVCAIGIRNSLKYGFWLVIPASIALIVVNGLPINETLFAESAFALVAMGYCAWRLAGWAGPKPT
jgi:hypothetical protein